MKKLFVLAFVCVLLFSFSSVLGTGMKGKFGISGRGGFSLPLGSFGENGSFSTSFSDSILGTDLKETGTAKTGFGFGASLEYFVTDNIAIGGYFDYQKFDLDVTSMHNEASDIEDLTGLPVEITGDHRIQSFGVFGKYVFTASPRVAPYLKLGLGMGKVKSKLDLSITGETGGDIYKISITGDRESGMKLSLDMGGGVMFNVSGNVWITGEVIYTYLGVKGSEGDIDWLGTGTINGESETFFSEKVKDEFDYNATRLSAYLGLAFYFGS
jgi:opacity protein-like surface antigen